MNCEGREFETRNGLFLPIAHEPAEPEFIRYSWCDLSHEELYDQLTTVYIVDTKTGETVSTSSYWLYWWIEGNGSCDCNRRLLFDDEEDDDEEDDGYCFGCERYLIFRAEPLPTCVTVDQLNIDYPEELQKEWMKRTAGLTGTSQGHRRCGWWLGEEEVKE